MEAKLALCWSPEQIAGWLRRQFPGDDSMQISHEAIYLSLYDPRRRQAIDRSLTQRLRSARPMRRPKIARRPTGRGIIRGMVSMGLPSRATFDHLVAISEPYWDALAEAAFQRRFHRPRSYLHPQASSLDHYHRLLTALLRRRRAVTSTLLAQLLNVGRTNQSNQLQDGHRLLDLHRVAVTPLPGTPAHTLTQLQAHLPSRDEPDTHQL
ncbi:hypothetical protein [Streptomyces noursei]|uniref:hypothetical protein n=1 Tax=Streptomyces noursei TaxID=1971 RepID=UPI0039B0C2FE